MGLMVQLSKWLGRLLVWLLLLSSVSWAFGALWYDLRRSLAWLFAGGIAAVWVMTRRRVWSVGLTVCAVSFVLAWWLTQQPSNDRVWQPDVAELPWADVKGDEVTLHNVRNFEYRTATDFTPRWETRVVHLSQITGVDMFINYWGSSWMAHPVVSFQFADSPPLCFSIETRKEEGEKYSAIGGLYRQFELYYVVADEQDTIRLRTSIRPGEESYLYRTRMTPEKARERLMEYLSAINQLRDHPRWYHAITTNCTTAIRDQHDAGKRHPWDWRMLVNGKADELLYERGLLATDGQPFDELRKKSLINEAAQKAGNSTEFSKLIREGRPGFGDVPNHSR